MKNSNNLLRTKFMDIDLDNVSINGKRFPDWDEKNQEAFFDGLIGNNTISKTKSTGNSTNSSKNSSKNWTDKFNIGNPDKDKGHRLGISSGSAQTFCFTKLKILFHFICSSPWRTTFGFASHSCYEIPLGYSR